MSVTVYLQNGPCQGQTKVLTDAQFKTGVTTCKGATYRDTGGYIGRPPLHLFRYDASTGGGGAGGSGHAPHAMAGWHDFRLQVNQGLPSALRRADKLNRGALSALARRRRVRR